VLDGIDPGANGPLRASRPMRVSGGLLAKGVGFIDQRVQLFLSHLRSVNIIRERQYAAGCAGLDNIGAVLHIQADRSAHGFGSVSHALLDTRLLDEYAVTKT